MSDKVVNNYTSVLKKRRNCTTTLSNVTKNLQLSLNGWTLFRVNRYYTLKIYGKNKMIGLYKKSKNKITSGYT